jgi:hypothetical protein
MATKYPELLNNDDKDYIFNQFESELKSLTARFDRLYKTTYFKDNVDVEKFKINTPLPQISLSKVSPIQPTNDIPDDNSDSDDDDDDYSEVIGSSSKITNGFMHNANPFKKENRTTPRDRKKDAPIHVEAEINGTKVQRSYTSERHKQFGLFKSIQYANYLKQMKEARLPPSWTSFMKLAGDKWKTLTSEERADPTININWVQ